MRKKKSRKAKRKLLSKAYQQASLVGTRAARIASAQSQWDVAGTPFSEIELAAQYEKAITRGHREEKPLGLDQEFRDIVN